MRQFLQPGDCLLYNSGGILGWAIKVKTWHRVSHCEGYVGDGVAVASRGPQDGKGGVQRYPLRLTGLEHVMRPLVPFDVAVAMAWFATVEGQGYDYWALARFFTIGQGSQTKMMCSECLTRWYRAGRLEPFQPDEDADLVAPSSFLTSARFSHYKVHPDGTVTQAHA